MKNVILVGLCVFILAIGTAMWKAYVPSSKPTIAELIEAATVVEPTAVSIDPAQVIPPGGAPTGTQPGASTAPPLAEHTAVNCPLCGGMAQWTGQTEVKNSQTWYVMKCVKGHRFLSPNL